MNNMTIKVEPKTPPEGSQVNLNYSRKTLMLDAMTFQNETKFSAEYFDELLFSLDGLSISTVVLYLMGLCIIIPGFAGIIWYEKYGNHRNRTLINQMNATLSWILLLYFVSVAPFDVLRYLIGPYGKAFCEFHQFMRISIWVGGYLVLGVVISLRYIFIFRLSNFAVINDGVLAVVINLSICLLVLWTVTVKRFAIGELPIYYYICLGIDPNQGKGPGYYQEAPKKYNASLILWIFCTLLHIFLWPKIFSFRRKAEKNVEPIELGCFNQENKNRSSRQRPQSSSPLSKSIMDMTTHGLFLTMLVAVGIVVNKQNDMEPLEVKQNAWLPYLIQLIGPSLIVSGFVLLSYARNDGLRASVTREAKEKLSHIFRNIWQ